MSTSGSAANSASAPSATGDVRGDAAQVRSRQLAAQLLHGRVHARRVATVDHDGRAARREPRRDRAADALGGPADEGRPAAEVELHRSEARRRPRPRSAALRPAPPPVAGRAAAGRRDPWSPSNAASTSGPSDAKSARTRSRYGTADDRDPLLPRPHAARAPDLATRERPHRWATHPRTLPLEAGVRAHPDVRAHLHARVVALPPVERGSERVVHLDHRPVHPRAGIRDDVQEHHAHRRSGARRVDVALVARDRLPVVHRHAPHAPVPAQHRRPHHARRQRRVQQRAVPEDVHAATGGRGADAPGRAPRCRAGCRTRRAGRGTGPRRTPPARARPPRSTRRRPAAPSPRPG